MKRAVYAISAAAIAFIAAGTMLNATPIAPIAAVTNTASTNSGQVNAGITIIGMLVGTPAGVTAAAAPGTIAERDFTTISWIVCARSRQSACQNW